MVGSAVLNALDRNNTVKANGVDVLVASSDEIINILLPGSKIFNVLLLNHTVNMGHLSSRITERIKL